MRRVFVDAQLKSVHRVFVVGRDRRRRRPRQVVGHSRLQATVAVQAEGGRGDRAGAHPVLKLVVGELQADGCRGLLHKQGLDKGGSQQQLLLAEADLAAAGHEEGVAVARQDGARHELHESLRAADPSAQADRHTVGHLGLLGQERCEGAHFLVGARQLGDLRLIELALAVDVDRDAVVLLQTPELAVDASLFHADQPIRGVYLVARDQVVDGQHRTGGHELGHLEVVDANHVGAV